MGLVGSVAAALLTAFAGAALLTLALTPPLREAARRRGWVDHPDGQRKLHARAVPRVGGVAVMAAFAAAFVAAVQLFTALGWSDPSQGDAARHLLVATAGITLVGLLDDVRGASPWVKLLAQCAGGLWLYNHGYDTQVLANPFGAPVTLGWMSLPLTLLWIVGMSNAFNLIDGLDGLASGVGLFASAVMCTYALLNERWEIALMAAALGGAQLGFLRYNFSPATVFLGDCGSLSIGFVLAALSLRGSAKSSMVVAVATPLLALGFPILDTLLAMGRRLVGGRSILQADANHIHHRLLRMGMTPRRVAVLLYGTTAVFGAMALLSMTGRNHVVMAALAAFSAFTWLGIRWLGTADTAPLAPPTTSDRAPSDA